MAEWPHALQLDGPSCPSFKARFASCVIFADIHNSTVNREVNLAEQLLLSSAKRLIS